MPRIDKHKSKFKLREYLKKEITWYALEHPADLDLVVKRIATKISQLYRRRRK